MDKRIALVLLALLATGIECRREFERYLHIPQGEELNARRFSELAEILDDETIQFGEPVLMLSQLEAKLPEASGLRKQVYSDLISLADLSSNTCGAAMLKTCLDISGLFYQSLDEPDAYRNLQPYVLFIKRMGEPKFNLCLETLTAQFQEAFVKYGAAENEAFDKLIAAAFDAESADDEELYQTARSFHLAFDEFHAARMVEAARGGSPLAASPKGQQEFLVQQLELRCAKMESALGGLFDLFNLSRTLEKPGAEPIDRSGTPIKFLKLNEYYRICLELQSAEKRADVESNIAKQLENSN